MAISLAYFTSMLAPKYYFSLQDRLNYQSKLGTFVQNVTKSPLFSSKLPYL